MLDRFNEITHLSDVGLLRIDVAFFNCSAGQIKPGPVRIDGIRVANTAFIGTENDLTQRSENTQLPCRLWPRDHLDADIRKYPTGILQYAMIHVVDVGIDVREFRFDAGKRLGCAEN